MLQRAKIMWDDDLVIQCMSDEMEFAVTYSIPDIYFVDELKISALPYLGQVRFLGNTSRLIQGLIVLPLSLKDVRCWGDLIEIVSLSGLDCSRRKYLSFWIGWLQTQDGRLPSEDCTTVSVSCTYDASMRKPEPLR